MGPAITSKKWIQVCEGRAKTVAPSKAQLYNSKGQARPSKAQNPVANVVVGQYLHCRHLPMTADGKSQVAGWTPMRIICIDFGSDHCFNFCCKGKDGLRQIVAEAQKKFIFL